MYQLSGIQLDDCISWTKPKTENYDQFTGLVIEISKKHNSISYRKEYIMGWNQESEELYNEFQETNYRKTADALLSSLDKARKEKWINTVEEIYYKRSSRKAWNLLRKLTP